MVDDNDPTHHFSNMADEILPEAEARYREYRGRRNVEAKLWQNWNQSGRKEEHLEPLLHSMKPLIRSEANKRLQGLGGSIPRGALESELTIAAVKSLQTYDPQKNTALTTHVTNGFRRISDFVGANRNAKYMPSADIKRYDRFQNAKAELHDELGREPSAEELHRALPSWKLNDVKRMQKGFGRELYTDLGDGVTQEVGSTMFSPRDAFALARPQLTPQQREFGHLYFPPEGEKRPTIKNIATTLGIPSHKAYTLKKQVEQQVGKYHKRQ